MTDPAFTVRAGASGPVVTGTPGNVLAFDASGTKLEGVPGGGGGAVSSVFTRTGAVIAAVNDYAASQVSNDSSVAGTGVKGALNTLLALIGVSGVSSFNTRVGAVVPAANDYAASQVTNDSSVAGTGVKGALNTLLASIAGLVTGVSSFNSRAGAVVPAANDYSAQQIFQIDIAPVAAATTGNVVLSGIQTIDGVANPADVMVWQNTNPSENGLYVPAAGAWARRADQNAANEFRPGVFFKIAGGNTYGGNLGCLLTVQPIVVGTTPLQYGVTSPGPLPSTNDGNEVVPVGGVLTYVNSPSHTTRLLAQTASLAAQTLLTAPPPDLYSFDVVLECTGAGTGTVLCTFQWTDDVGATTIATATLILTGTGRAATGFLAYVASGNVTFTTTVTGSGVATYNVTARAARKLSKT